MEMDMGMEIQEAAGRKRYSHGEGEAARRSKKRDPEADARKRAAEEYAAWQRRMAEEMDPKNYCEEDGDIEARDASVFRDGWNFLWAGLFGSFEQITPIGPMRFTDGPLPEHACTNSALQIFSIKVAGIRGGLQWPLDAFGMVAVRDTVDHNRNILFSRTRDDCQTLAEKDSDLVLTGPTRAVVVMSPVYFEVVLKVKGSTESEDKDLSFLAVNYDYYPFDCSHLINREYTSKLSTLELTFAQVVSSVEATISVEVIDGSFPDGFHGRFTAHTASIHQQKVCLLDSGDEKVPVNADGMVKLSRHVASVELEGELEVSVEAWRVDNKIEVAEADVSAPKKVVKKASKVFIPKTAGRSYGTLKVRFCKMMFCKMKVTVAWSLLSYIPGDYAAHNSGEADAT